MEVKEIKHSPAWGKGYKQGLKDGKQAFKESREEKRQNRKNEIRREVVAELTQKLKDIFGFLTDDDLNARMERHLDNEHTP